MYLYLQFNSIDYICQLKTIFIIDIYYNILLQSTWEFKVNIIELQRKKEFREAFEIEKTDLTIYPTNSSFFM